MDYEPILKIGYSNDMKMEKVTKKKNESCLEKKSKCEELRNDFAFQYY